MYFQNRLKDHYIITMFTNKYKKISRRIPGIPFLGGHDYLKAI